MIDLSRLRVQIWPIDRLLPYIRNARTHTDAQVAQVAASITGIWVDEPAFGGGRRNDHRRPREIGGSPQAEA
jgi:hypothetical protein